MEDVVPQAVEPLEGSADLSEETIRLDSLPKEVGVLLIVAGIGGVVLPGPVGTPFILIGGAVLFPKVFQGLERKLEKRFPNFHREGMRQVKRFVYDLERRYPTH